MKTIFKATILSAILCMSAVFISASVFAESYTVTSIGDFDFVNGSNGYSGSGMQIGDFYYYHDNR